MTTAAIRYVSLQGLADVVACRSTMHALASEVRGFNATLDTRAANFTVRVMHGPEDAEDVGFDAERYLPFTGGVFPMVYFSLTYDPEKLPDHQRAEWEKKYDLKITSRGISPVDIFALEPPPH